MASGVRLPPLESDPSDDAVEAAATRIQAVARGRKGRAMLGGLAGGALVEGLTKIEEAVEHGARRTLERTRSGLTMVAEAADHALDAVSSAVGEAVGERGRRRASAYAPDAALAFGAAAPQQSDAERERAAEARARARARDASLSLSLSARLSVAPLLRVIPDVVGSRPAPRSLRGLFASPPPHPLSRRCARRSRCSRATAATSRARRRSRST